MSTTVVIAIVATAVLAVILGPIVFLMMTEVKLKELDGITRRRLLIDALPIAGVLGVAALLPGLVAGGVFDHPAAPPIAGVLGCGAVLLLLHQGAGAIAEVQRAGRKLLDPATRDVGLARIRELLDKTDRSDMLSNSVALAAAVSLSNARMHGEALPIFQSVVTKDLDEHQREMIALGVLSCQLYTGDKTGARESLAALPQMEPGSIHGTVAKILEARLLVEQGRSEQALDVLPGPFFDKEVEQSRHVARAHAYAAQGKLEQVRESLEWLRDEVGDEGLRWAVEPEGPASVEARGMLTGAGGPYRR